MATSGFRSFVPILVGLLVLTAVGLAVEHRGAFPLLRLALQRSPADLPSSLIAPADAVGRGDAVLSLFVDEKDLYDRDTGILRHTTARGREWERAVTLSYYEDGVLRHASGAGLRIHGGSSRFGTAVQSYRVFFRRDYGVEEFAPGVIFGSESHPLRRIVVHNDVRLHAGRYWHLTNPLAYDIARKIGCLTVDTKPVRFYLNGEKQGLYVLSEHLGPNYFRTHFGHEDFFPTIVQANRLWRRVFRLPHMTMATVGELVDIENLTRWFLSILMCDTHDAFQAPNQFRDERRPGAKWFWINWDMDASFMEWNHDTFQASLERVAELRRGRRPNEPRPYVLTRLLEEDPEYRAYFARLFDQMLNHQVTSEYLRERYEHYERIAVGYGVRDRRYLVLLREYIERRPAFLRQLTEEHLNLDPSRRVFVRNRGQQPLLVDGFRISTDYEGLYLSGNELQLEVPEESRARFAGWSVDGRSVPATQQRLSIPVRADLTVEAVFR